ncbi:NUDIX domain-containing protein [Streptomyces silvisoli]|uniref:NUDIX domain-containing protein n=1 Tax=Streptomyces silvisoli TaxID=3034235 RepID=A0ABT5ZKF7_9ACTN|nr:NUDIX domain-containing protein [Streptomyces silvisoli]MDF3290313.1 NUDIX domain-containing protein [Streptomyces silvisoli]
MKLRHSVRAIILDEDDHILLCRLVIPERSGTIVVWAAPGGGLERGETLLQALQRELHEEVGLTIDAEPTHVWHQEVVDSETAAGYDGVVNDYFLVRTASFDPRGAMTVDELAAENIRGVRWWGPKEIADYRGPDLFSPRDLATPLTALIVQGVPATPVLLGL